MKTRYLASLLLGTALSLAAGSVAFADDKTVKIGVLTDQSGLYADLAGPGSTLAAQMAVEDIGLPQKGWKIDVIVRRSPEQAGRRGRHRAQVVRRRKDRRDRRRAEFRRRLAVSAVVKEKNGVFLIAGAATSDLTDKACTPNNVHWTFDTLCSRQRHRQGGGQDGRRHLVLRHRRLRLRRSAASATPPPS